MKTDDRHRNLTAQEKKDLRTLELFIECWCRGQHHPLSESHPRTSLCPSCHDLLAYAKERRCACPLTPKPACKDCPVHCYRPERRAEIRQIMRFSGKRLLLRGRLDLLWHYFF